ncbi:imidazole glycerol phosphate synthase subunit HisH [bacterium]|nr:imidazole glycerol phosphate synthase subunit HisH [bacterium]
MIAILDFGLGNLRSILNGFIHLGHDAVITPDKNIILDADALVIPGVGAFKDCMDRLAGLDLVKIIREAISCGKPVLGICLGLQLLFSESEEFGLHKGIGVFEGKVRAFTGPLKIPHMGWNILRITRQIPLLEGIKDGEYFYFVHSFYADANDEGIIAGKTGYGIEFPSVVQKDNLMATQFHPEKSSLAGLRILDNFARMTSN